MKLIQAFTLMLLMAAATPRSFFAGPPAQGRTNVAGRPLLDKPVTLPKDVDPESLSRIPLVKREDLTDAEKKSYDALDDVDKKGGVGLRGPANISLHYPGLSEGGTNSFMRKSPLGGKEYELTILVIAREFNAQVMWTAHEPEAIEHGVSKAAVDVVKFRKPVTGLDEREATIIQFGRELFQKDKVSSDTFVHAKKVFGEKNLVLLTGMFVQRIGTALYSRAFDQSLNPTWKPLLPIP
jgi:4-carboxymuconolactone decarboxylase